MDEAVLERLRCPSCHGGLERAAGELRCATCSASYSTSGRVLRFVERDGFYEGRYPGSLGCREAGGLIGAIRLHLSNTHYLSWIVRHVPSGARILEVGCAGGTPFLASRYRATGLDVCLSALESIAGNYELVVQANVVVLPFPDHSYDAAVAAYVWEHISPEDRPHALRELWRVLRPGGHLVLLFDVECHNPLFQWYRRQPERFRAGFIERDRHYGLERASTNLARLTAAGFQIVAAHAANKTPLQYPSVYEWGAQHDDWLSRGLARVARAVSARQFSNVGYVLAVTALDDLVEPLLPLDWARLLLVVARRPEDCRENGQRPKSVGSGGLEPRG